MGVGVAVTMAEVIVHPGIVAVLLTATPLTVLVAAVLLEQLAMSGRE